MVLSMKRVVIVLGLVFASSSLAHGQSLEHRLTSSQPAVSTATLSPARQAPVAAPFVLQLRDLDEHNLNRDDRNFARSSSFHVTRTPFMTESRLPIAQTSGSRVQLNFFATSTNNQRVLQGPLMVPQSTQALAQPRGSDQYGVGISIPLGRDGGSLGSKDLWRGVSRVLYRR
jgi:hypothetical protein